MIKIRIHALAWACACLSCSTLAFAETSQTPSALEGADAVSALMDSLLVDLGLIDGSGIESYNGIGSSAGQRQMIGKPNLLEPLCNDTNGGENVGCQEIAPMTIELHDYVGLDTDGDPEWQSPCSGNTEAYEQAESIAFCKDSVAVIADNATLGAYGDSAAACSAYGALANTGNAGSPPSFPDRGVGNLADTGTLPATGYVLGAGMPASDRWKDALRVIYTGCLNTDGDCVTINGFGNTSSGVPSRKRTVRCNSAVRRELLGDLRNILEGVECGERCEEDLSDGQTTLPGHRADDGVNDKGLRHAFRTDDASGASRAFLDFLGVRPTLRSRAKITSTALESIADGGCSAGLSAPTAKLITPIPENFAFCDGGDREGWAPDCQNDTIIALGGDPIRKNCSDADDLCGPDMKAPIVQAIRSVRGANPYPAHQCTRGQFDYKNYLASPHDVCPDGSKPQAGQCKLPFYSLSGGGQNFDCLNPFNSRPSTVPGTTDGRAYNVVMRTSAGVVDQPNGNTVEIANWRQNMATMALSGTPNIFGKAFAAADYVCREQDATQNLGCVVSEATCSIGFASRTAAFAVANNHHLGQEPLLIKDIAPTNSNTLASTYPMARYLWLGALGGMEQVTAQCLARGDTADFCAEQKRIADEVWGAGLSGNLISELCSESGFVPLPRSDVFCKGPSSACGAPTTQAMSACLPN